jgi:hypothetical protein
VEFVAGRALAHAEGELQVHAAELVLVVAEQISAAAEQIFAAVEQTFAAVEQILTAALPAFLYVPLAWRPPADLVLAWLDAGMLFVVLHSEQEPEYG